MAEFQRVTMIGLGLMGGSFAMALRDRSDSILTGYDISDSATEEAKRMNLIDIAADTLSSAVEHADLVVLATPVGAYQKLVREMLPHLKKNAVITDLGSVKVSAIQTFETLPETITFIGGHPLAGSEKGGLSEASPYLFENAYYFLTPHNKPSEGVVHRMKTLISTLGAFPVMLQPDTHDRILAKTSHFPHIMASLLAVILSEQPEENITAFTGSGFRDTTRIASGNPDLWEEILYLNRVELIACLKELELKTASVRQALTEGNRTWIHEFLKQGKHFRDHLPKSGKDYLPAWYEIYVDIKDEPGALAVITGTLAGAGVNIREIEILHAREGDKGAVRLAFTTQQDEQHAMKSLNQNGFSFARSKGEMSHVDIEQIR